MPSALSLQKPRPGMGMVVLVDGAAVETEGLEVVVVVGAVVVTTGLSVVVETPGLEVVVVVGGSGGISENRNHHANVYTSAAQTYQVLNVV